MRKKIIYGLVVLFSVMLVFALVACGGSNGVDGSNGKNGIDGKSAYQIWLDNGHTGTETDFLDWLKGSDGANGQDGKKGDTGEQGVKGDKGQDGVDGKDGVNGLSAYEIFLKYNSDYTGTEEQWINGLVNNKLIRHTITFQSEVSDDIVKTVFDGFALTEIPEVPEKEGQTSAIWNITDFSNITSDMTVTAQYDMRKYVTFHNEYTNDEDIEFVVNYGEAITNVPEIVAKIGNDSKWSVTDFSHITEDMRVNAVYETRGLQYTLINQQTEYKVSKGEMNPQTQELFISAKIENKNVAVIDKRAFMDCSSIQTVHMPNGIRNIDEYAFCGCIKLENILLGEHIKTIGEAAFQDCHSLANMVIPNSIMLINAFTFIRCYDLTDIVIPNGVTAVGMYAFSECLNLTDIVIPNSVTEIQSGAFQGCIKLESVTIPKGVTLLAQNVFNSCESLTSIIITGNVTSIGERAFLNCPNLTEIRFNGTMAQWNAIKKESQWDNDTGNYTVYCTDDNIIPNIGSDDD